MGKVLRVRGVGHIDNRHATRFRLARERIHGEMLGRMVPDISDVTPILRNDDGLVCRPALQVVVASQLHIPLRLLVVRVACRIRGHRSVQRNRCDGRSMRWVLHLCDEGVLAPLRRARTARATGD